MIDTGTTLVLAPTNAAFAIFSMIPNAGPISGADYDNQMFFAYPCSTPSKYIPSIKFAGQSFAINPLDFNFGILTADFARSIGNETLAVRLEEKVAAKAAKRARQADDGGNGDTCVAAIVGSDVVPQENLYVVGDAFLKNWYTTFNYVNSDGGPSVSFAKGV